MRNRHLFRAPLSFIVALSAVALVASPAVADPSDGGGSDVPPPPNSAGLEGRYIQADTSEEAEEKFAAIEKEESGDSTPETRRLAAVKYGPCTLEVQGVYLRKSFQYNSVGFKTYTKCSTDVTSIRHDMRLQEKQGLLWKENVPTSGPSNINYGAAALSSKGTVFLCSSKDTDRWWSGSAKGRVVYNGETYYSTGTAPVSQAKIPCSS